MKIRYLLAALALGTLPVSAAHAVNVSIDIAPPALVTYEQPACPTEGYLWTPGYWAYDTDYYWVPGVWVAPPRIGYLWTPGYWGYSNGFYAFNAGYWGPTVGFYGGINYGYGYGGYGYYGGRWEGRSFRYNTSVTRVNVNNVHNTYVDNSAHDRTNSRASFNGRGGVVAKADARERAAANSSHVRATAAQTSALRDARSSRGAQTQRRTADRTQNQRATPEGRTAGNPRDARISRNKNTSNARVAPTRTTNNQRMTRTSTSRNNGMSRNRTMTTRSSRGGRSTARVVNSSATSVRAPQNQRAQVQRSSGRSNGKRH